MDPTATVSAALTLRKGGHSGVGRERIALLQAVAEEGTITAAARRVGMSYKAAWDAVQTLNNLFGRPLVAPQAGGRAGGGSELTPAGHELIAAFHAVEAELAQVAERLERRLGGSAAAMPSLLWSMAMKSSARNVLRGVVSRVVEGGVNAEVVLDIADGVAIVAVVTEESVGDLGLAPGKAAFALIKASMVILAAGHGVPRTSARNSLEGVVIRREDGAVNSEVVLEIAAGKTITATLTRESAEALDLRVGAPATALIKASHVILMAE